MSSKYLLLAAGAAAAYGVYRWFTRDQASADCAQLIRGFDRCVSDGRVDDASADAQVVGGTAAIVHRAAAHLKVKFGLLTNSAANRLLLSEEVRKWMLEEVRMRPSHVVKYYPLAVELALLPDECASRAIRVGGSRLAKRLHLAGHPW